MDEVTAGTNEYDLKDTVDHVSEGHPVPVVLIEDHFAELAQGINPATCKVCGAPMELHAQFEPTMQHYAEVLEPESVSLPAHLAAEHDMPDLGELDPVEDGLILDRLYAIHEAKHVEANEEDDAFNSMDDGVQAMLGPRARVVQMDEDWNPHSTDHTVVLYPAEDATETGGHWHGACDDCDKQHNLFTHLPYDEANFRGQDHIRSERRKLSIPEPDGPHTDQHLDGVMLPPR